MAKTEISGTVVILLVVLVLAVLFVVGKCSFSCSTKSGYQRPLIEGYKRSCLANDCFGLQRTPVDYAFKYPHGWQRNPHWQAFPGDEHQPLDYGPIDFHLDARRLNANHGVLFQQYRQDWGGCGKNQVYLVNDSKNRFDLTNVGDQGAREVLDDMYNPRFGPRGISHTEQTYNEPNPYFDKIYGGHNWLVHDLLGD